jgi:hypothetical protein
MKRFVFECECGNIKFSASSTNAIHCSHQRYSTKGIIGPYEENPAMTLIGSIDIQPVTE